LACAPVAAGLSSALLAPRSGLIVPDPVAAEELWSAQEIGRARRYGLGQMALGAAGGLLQGGVLLALARRPPAALLRAQRAPLAATALTAAGLAAVDTVVGLPTAALTRRRALRVGLATQSWRGWAGDTAKATAIGAGLAALAAPATVGLMRRRGDRWWLPGAVGAVGAGAALSFLAPVALDPLFNRFTPLPAGELREQVLDLARRAGVRVREVYESDASRRTTAANAYVAGYGASRRIVLWDTLLREFSPAEARLVVAHELAHVRHRDVQNRLVALAAMAPVAARAVARVTGALDRSPEPGPATVAPLALAAGVVGALMGPPGSALSRRVESRADAFALALTDEPEPFVSFEQRIVRQNLADPDPPRLLVRLFGTHPPAVERIGVARAYARGVRAGY
jgi:STE24 endopeptidase